MAANRIMRAGGGRAALALLASAVAALMLAACGGGGTTTTVAVDKPADAEVLNQVLGRQEAAVAAYRRSLPALHGPALALAGLLHAQEQEHADAILKSLRGLGAQAEPRPETLTAQGLKTSADYLRFFYEIESATIEQELTAIAKLTTPEPRSMLAATVANQAQHLVLLRRHLGAKPLQTVPAPFETGATPAP